MENNFHESIYIVQVVFIKKKRFSFFNKFYLKRHFNSISIKRQLSDFIENDLIKKEENLFYDKGFPNRTKKTLFYLIKKFNFVIFFYFYLFISNKKVLKLL